MTLAPFVVIALTAGPYWLFHRSRGNLENEAGRRSVKRIKYSVMFFIYIILPSVSTSVITYFSCDRFDRGAGREDLKVVAVQLSVQCFSRRYNSWAIYVAIMIAIYPIGATLDCAILLWCSRAKLNPALDADSVTADGGDGFSSGELRRHARAMDQAAKLELRSTDDSIAGLEFLFEEYEPRCYLFPIFEIARRIFLSSVLAVFYPGSTQQVVVGFGLARGAALMLCLYLPRTVHRERRRRRICRRSGANDTDLLCCVGGLYCARDRPKARGLLGRRLWRRPYPDILRQLYRWHLRRSRRHLRSPETPSRPTQGVRRTFTSTVVTCFQIAWRQRGQRILSWFWTKSVHHPSAD